MARLTSLHLAASAALLLGACSGAEGTAEQARPSGTTLLGERLDGGTLDLARLADERNVVLVFWQPWCASCILEMPELVDASRAHPELSFVGVVSGPDRDVDESEVREVLADFEVPYPQLRDRTLALTRGYSVEGTPTILLIGAGGTLLEELPHAPPDWSAWERK